jgi:tetratricopeptide (TPR) repeat protein
MADRVTPDREENGTTATVAEPALRRAAPAVLPGVDRFTVLDKLGEGGMGTVFAAYDKRLDRKVALKMVRADRRRKASAVSPRDQLLREAQAMARLAHPNVVTVFEVGEHADAVYLVIEFVDGTTLDEWQKQSPRSWREIVAAFIQVGRGLAAAHAAGLVHRDVKPSNILVRRDGRVQITDFGVVSMGGHSTESSDDSDHEGAEFTYAGHRVGTPGYMAPEQHAGGPIDARADQFSFGVALWEALFGVRPFAGNGDERLRAARAGTITAPRANSGVPKYIEQVVRRALAAQPADRYASFEELLGALARDPVRTRRRRLALAAGTVGVVVLAAIGLLGWTRTTERALSPCTGGETRLVGRWDATRAAAVRAAFAADPRPYARSTGERIVADLDVWAKRWVAMRGEACRATRVTGEQSEALLDARMHCLDRQLEEITQLATALSGTDRSTIARVPQLELPDITVCADRDAVLARVPPPTSPLLRERVVQLEEELVRINTLERGGRYRDARNEAVRVAAQATALGFAPLTAEALLTRGRVEDQDGDTKAARASLADAARVAAAARDDRTQAAALIDLVRVLYHSGELAEALTLSIAATAAVERTNDRGLEAELAEQVGAVHEAKGTPEAEAHLQRALALHEQVEHDSLNVARVLNKLAGLWLGDGRVADARKAYERALLIATEKVGAEHPATAIARANVCFLDSEQGKLAEARACQESVLATLERALGEEHPQVAWALNEVALVQRQQGETAAAKARFERALAIWERASGPTHPDVAWPLINLGELANEARDHAAAEALCGRAREVLDRAKLAASDVAPALVCLAEALIRRKPREAVAVATRAHEAVANTPAAAELAKLVARSKAAAAKSR